MFNFRIIDTVDGNQIIDRRLKTPYSSLTPLQMVEYTEMDNQLAYMERMEHKQKREAERQRKFTYKLFHKVACMCGIMQEMNYGGVLL